MGKQQSFSAVVVTILGGAILVVIMVVLSRNTVRGGGPQSVEEAVQEKADEYYSTDDKERRKEIAMNFERLFRDGMVLTPVAREVVDDYNKGLRSGEETVVVIQQHHVGKRNGVATTQVVQQKLNEYNKVAAEIGYLSMELRVLEKAGVQAKDERVQKVLASRRDFEERLGRIALEIESLDIDSLIQSGKTLDPTAERIIRLHQELRKERTELKGSHKEK